MPIVGIPYDRYPQQGEVTVGVRVGGGRDVASKEGSGQDIPSVEDLVSGRTTRIGSYTLQRHRAIVVVYRVVLQIFIY